MLCTSLSKPLQFANKYKDFVFEKSVSEKLGNFLKIKEKFRSNKIFTFSQNCNFFDFLKKLEHFEFVIKMS